ncbi:cytoplasmic protein [Peribacillus cavernae]|uniref:Cytoplasmic protein n=1 Tax=Peribacillus cavernae TaxID=1674310 RepID=A0A3S0U5F5_9BACI|nr:cytoplasmic protein [Peribacillus cavernae]MDQ0218368.1 cytoskeletal protein CcmA (bactofilin family) [Peribacillus cavernae]RUQ31379.1 cytoplasmic protein [Peribacillus cavernae]
MVKNQNLIINGSGSYPGGSYDKISIRGEGTIISDVECSVFKIYGTSESLENVKADCLSVYGEAEIKGNIDSGEAHVLGTMSISGKVQIKQLKMRGMLDAGGRLTGEKADIKGSLSVQGDVEYDTFYSRGSFEIKGLLNAETIRIGLRYGCSSAEEIGGGKIIVKKKASLIPFVKEEGTLSAKVIEGDEIYLENTKAEVVRGNTVKIGPGCEIGLVEYSVDFSQSDGSTVKTKIKQKGSDTKW